MGGAEVAWVLPFSIPKAALPSRSRVLKAPTSPFLPSISLQHPLQTGLTIVLTEREKCRVQSGTTGQVLKVNAELMSIFSATQLSCTIVHLFELPCCIPTDNISILKSDILGTSLVVH